MSKEVIYNFHHNSILCSSHSTDSRYQEMNDRKGFDGKELTKMSDSIAKNLIAKGLKKGECVAIISNNRPEWILADMGVMKAGGITVPIYANLSTADCEFIFQDAQVKFCFVENQFFYVKIMDFISPDCVFSFEETDNCPYYKSLLGGVSGVLKHDAVPYDTATIIYTSGTTGKPKGVMLTHQNLMSNISACMPLLPVVAGDRALSFLPIAHVFERMLVYLYLHKGLEVFFSPSLDHIAEDIKKVKPHIFTAVPRIIEKFMEAVQRSGQGSFVRKHLLNWALNIAARFPEKRWGHIFAETLVFEKIKTNLGGSLKGIICGSAALDPQLNCTFWGIGIPVYEGYGMTETSPVVSVNFKNNYKFGTVGKAISGVEIVIAEDGEILVKGKNVMKGYFKQDEITHASIDAGGYFHTGDLGMIDSDGYLKITGRKKELFKTSGGKYINPSAIENAFTKSPFIDFIMVVGENRKFPSALIVPNFLTVQKQLNLDKVSNAQLTANPEVRKLFDNELQRWNAEFGHWEQIKKYRLLSSPWSVETGELTPKLSLKRKVILEKYQKEIEMIYS